MKFHRKLWVILITATILLAVVVNAGMMGPAQAQGTAAQAVVYSAQAGLTQDKKGINLDILFGMVDATGNPSSDNPNPNADVTLDNGSGVTSGKISAPVSRPTSGMNIELVVDLTPSMGRVISQWKSPLIAFVQGLDSSAQVGFIGFTEAVPVVEQPLTSSRQDLLTAINDKLKAPSGNSGSCIYDALYVAVDRLRSAQTADPTKRRAVVLITDGKDALLNKTDVCSKHPLNDLIKHAFDPGDFVNRTPIYILGVKNPLSPDLDETNLRMIATGTSGQYLAVQPLQGQDLGVPTGNAFTNVKLALNSQWHVVVPVTGPDGDWKATVTIGLPNGQSLPPFTVNYKIIKDWLTLVSTATPTPSNTPEPQVGIKAVGLNPDDPSQLLVTVLVEGDASVISYVATILDTTTNTQIDSQRLNQPLKSPVTLLTNKLKAGNSYTLTIQGEDQNGKIISMSSPYGFIFAPPATATPGPTATPGGSAGGPVGSNIQSLAPILLSVVAVLVIGLIGLLFFVMRPNRQKGTPEWRSDLTGAGIMMQGPPGFQQQPYQSPPQGGAAVNEYTNPVPLLIRPAAALTITQSRDKNLMQGQRFDIQETPFRIGREGPDLMITSDDRVSRRHAIIDYGPSGYFVEDQGSTHGTFVNGQKVQGKANLVDGAEVGIGPGTILTFSIASSPRDMDRTNAVPLTPLDR